MIASGLLLFCSVLFLAAAVFFLIKGKRYKGLFATLLFFASDLFLNYAAFPPLEGLHIRGNLFLGLMSAFQTFTLDASYDEIISNLSGMGYLCKAYAAILLTIAPIVGGAAVLNVLSGVFPYFHFLFRNLLCKETIVFSFLNEQSYELLGSMEERGELHSGVCVVFANTWIEEGNEDESAMVESVKRLNAICVKRNASEIRTSALRKKRRIRYFFIRSEDERNLDDVLSVTSGESRRLWKNSDRTEMYVYAQGELAPRVLEQIYSGMEEDVKEIVHISIIPYQTTTVLQTLFHYPLYAHLDADPEKEEDLTVILAGAGEWMIEIFRTVFWCGQLPGKHLKVIMVCPDMRSMLKTRSELYYHIPELDVVENQQPYCEVSWEWMELNSHKFDQFMEQERVRHARVWFLVSGDDLKNAENAENIKSRLRALSILHQEENAPGTGAFIHYMVNDSSIQAALNKAQAAALKKAQEDAKKKGTPVTERFLLHAFGSLHDQYALDNVSGALHDIAWMLDDVWSGGSEQQKQEKEYRRRSSLAAALHIQYKLYAFGLLQYKSDTDTWATMKKALQQYDADFQERHKFQISYLEHRRWNAYTRSLGYRCVDIEAWQAYCERIGSIPTKDIAAKLHTCLVEGEEQPPFYGFLHEDGGKNWTKPEVEKAYHDKTMDALDRLSYALWLMSGKTNPNDLKEWDTYPVQDCAKKFLNLDLFRTIIRETLHIRYVYFYSPLSEILRKETDYKAVIVKLDEKLHFCDELKDILMQNYDYFRRFTVKDFISYITWFRYRLAAGDEVRKLLLHMSDWKPVRNNIYTVTIQKGYADKVYNIPGKPGYVYNTLEDAEEAVKDGDYIVTGVKGEMYPIKEENLGKYDVKKDAVTDEPKEVTTKQTDEIWAYVRIPAGIRFTVTTARGELKGNRSGVEHGSGDCILVKTRLIGGQRVPDMTKPGWIVNGAVFSVLYTEDLS